MNLTRIIQSRIRALFGKRKLDADMNEEMRSHIELRTQANMDSGMQPEEARLGALRQFGWAESIKEECRDQRGVRWLENLAQDIRFGARQLRKNPGFTTVAALTLALGIGANTAMFSIFDAVLLRPLAYPDSGNLVSLSERGADWSGGSIAYPNFLDWKSQQSVFEKFGIYNGSDFTLTGAGDPVRLSGAMMSVDVFAALRAQPEIGRSFSEDEDKPGAGSVALISHALWQTRFGGDAGIVNKTINLEGKPYTILGVMAAGFEFPNKVDFWLPLGPFSADASWKKRDYHPGLYGLARLKQGVTLEQAQADLDAIAVRLQQQYPDSNKTRSVRIDKLLDNKVGNIRRALWILLGAVGFVLIIACANVANLLLARAASREKEMAVRVAMGAGKWRIRRQLLTESGLLALLGAGVGLIIAKGALRIIAAVAGGSLPRAGEINLDPRVLLFSSVVAILTGLAFGLAPAWFVRRVDLHDTLKETGRGNTSGRARVRQGLVIAEVALTFVVLSGAGLLFLSFHQLLNVNPGFAVDNILTFHIDLPASKYQASDRQVLFYHGLLEKLRALPGVRAASLTSQVPLSEGGWDMLFVIEGRPEPPPYEQPSLQVHLISPGYFQSMGVPLLQGRDFTEQDNRDRLKNSASGNDWGAGLNSMIVDEEFAKRYWPNESPLGRRVRLPWGEREKQPVMTIVGVVGRVKKNQLSEQAGLVQAYFPMYQQPLTGLTAVVKTATDPIAMMAAIRGQVAQLGPALPLYGINTMKEMRDHNVSPNRLNLALLGGLATLALILAAIGLYGLLAFTVAQRQREIGVRLALGAQQRQVHNLIVGEGCRLIAFGIALGLVGSIALTRLLSALLFDIKPTDPLTLFTVTIILFAVALFACYIPARRAAKVDPMVALRSE